MDSNLNTDTRAPEATGFAAPETPSINLPKGGGAIRNMGEKFSTNPVSGTGSMSIPIATSPGRAGFGPSLALGYDSTQGNGPFGLGWDLSLAHISRRTDLGLPRYADAEDSDIFVLSGAEDLVPSYAKDANGNWLRDASGNYLLDEQTQDGYVIRRYQPRIESAFARIERWTSATDHTDVHWRSLSGSNVLSIYGWDANSRIADPAQPGHIFSWLVCETRDDKGNAVQYRYKAEDGAGCNPYLPSERNRGAAADAGRSANRYIKTIYYGNRQPLLGQNGMRPLALSAEQWAGAGWMFEVVFDYGEHDPDVPTPSEVSPWLFRADPLSSYRSGFEIRTTRLCRRVLMFHHFSEIDAVGADCLVKSTDFDYAAVSAPATVNTPAYSYLNAVSQSGYIRQGAAYQKLSMPPVTLTYTLPVVQDGITDLGPDALQNLPIGLDDGMYRWLDLHGEGTPGILAEQGQQWYYRRNLAPMEGAVSFGKLETVTARPNVTLNDARSHFMSLNGDGRMDLVLLDEAAPGFYRHDEDEGWNEFQAFAANPHRPYQDRNLKFVDLSGDARPDIMLTEEDALVWHPSLAELGFDRARRVWSAMDENAGPRVVFDDGTESIFLADMSGDGLQDIVRVRNGEICYWPNLGYGRFGARITMDNAPLMDLPERFDPARLRLADIDGSGTVDLVYLHEDGVQLYFNQSGNGWSLAQTLKVFPPVSDLARIMVADLLGNGTACLVWSSPLAGDAGRQVRYVNLMGEQKPHLLVQVMNNCGAETRVHYAPSTKFYLQDKRDGTPWATRLPFPVHVVEKVEVTDRVTGHYSSCVYRYRHGYYDFAEREFRGFGMVEQTDCEAFEDYVVGVIQSGSTQTTVPELNQAPVTTRTWFHTGAQQDLDRLNAACLQAYFQSRALLPAPVLPAGMNSLELRECLRALKGMPLRTEVYSFDGSSVQNNPYVATEGTVEVRMVQPQGDQCHAIFLVVGRESLTVQYDRNPADPRIAHQFLLEADRYGRTVKSCSVGYGRKIVDATLPAEVSQAQGALTISYTEQDDTPDVVQGSPIAQYRLGQGYASRSYEITGITPAADLFGWKEIADTIAGAAPIDYEVVASGAGAQKRLLSNGFQLFRDNALNPLPLGQLDSLGLNYRSYLLALTPALLAAQYNGQVSNTDLTDAGYVDVNGDGQWWIPSSLALFPASPAQHFYMPNGVRDPFGIDTIAQFDSYDLLAESVTVSAASWNTTSAVNDYRILGPIQQTDANQNRAAIEVDALGMVTKFAAMGKEGSTDGDTLADPTSRQEYSLFNWMNSGQPNFVHSFNREQHGAANPRWQESYSYTNGSGGVVMVKSQAHPGKALTLNPDGTTSEVDANPRWVGNGRTILNNKGNPVKRYLPYFSTNFLYEDEQQLRELGETPVMYYDPVGRLVKTLNPNGTLSRAEVACWQQKQFDANDTVKESQWYADRGSPDPATDPEPTNDPEKRAAWLAAKHTGTPKVIHSDSLGRVLYAVADYGAGKTAAVRSTTDFGGRNATLFDQFQREVARSFVGLAGIRIWGESAEKGRRWTFSDVLGAVIKTWDANGRQFRTVYDNLHRPTSSFVTEPGKSEILFSYVVFGDRMPNPLQANLLGRVHQIFDQSGMVRIPGLDFKGNPNSVDRILAVHYDTPIDWKDLSLAADYAGIQTAANAQLNMAEVFSASSTYDALNRPIQVVLPDQTVVVPTYNEANFLARLQAKIAGQGAFIDFLASQDYDAKGQRQFAQYGNSLVTQYFYDPATFRLTNLVTSKQGADPATQALQNLNYTYDPVGNVTQLTDTAQETNYFANAVVKPENLYEYDALYQLTGATGRELAGLTNNAIRTSSDLDAIGQLPHVNSADAVRNYSEAYDYDLCGNLLSLKHRFAPLPGVGSGWTRYYHYAHDDDPSNPTNRLTSSSQSGDPDGGPYTATYQYDAYGNMTQMPQLATMSWDFMDQLRQVDLGGGGTAYYVYGMNGERSRKVIERLGNEILEWIYLGSLMIFRRRRRDTGDLRFERRTVYLSDNTGKIAQVDTKTLDADGIDAINPLNTPLTRYRYTNRLGSATLETDDSGNPISYEEYHPFGTSSYRSSKPGYDLSLKRYRFSGKELDDETGLIYFGARYYAPWLGRWTSSDPGGFVDGLNLYRYCRNDPIGNCDPDGKDSYGFPNMPRDRRTDSHTHTEAAGARFEAWVRAQTIHLGDGDFRIREGTGTRRWMTDHGGYWTISAPELDEVHSSATATEEAPLESSASAPTPSHSADTSAGASSSTAQSDSSTPNPIAAPRQGAIATSAVNAGDGSLSSTLRGMPGGTPPSASPNQSLWDEPYNLWSGGVDWKNGAITPGGGVDEAMRRPGFIMEDTQFEVEAEQIARNLGHPDRFSVPYDTTPGSDFNQVWGPTSDSLATRAGLSQSTITSNGLDTHPNPGGTVQVTREFPRVMIGGGLMAQLGKFSGIMTIIASTGIHNDYARYTGYAAGATEFMAGNAYLIGVSSLGSGYFTAATTSGLMTFGRVGGGVGAGLAQAVIYGDMAVTAAEQHDDVAAYVYAGAAIGGVAIAVGAVIGAPVLVAAGALWGIFALGFQLGRWLRS